MEQGKLQKQLKSLASIFLCAVSCFGVWFKTTSDCGYAFIFMSADIVMIQQGISTKWMRWVMYVTLESG